MGLASLGGWHQDGWCRFGRVRNRGDDLARKAAVGATVGLASLEGRKHTGLSTQTTLGGKRHIAPWLRASDAAASGVGLASLAGDRHLV